MPQETKNIIQLKESTSGPNFYPETHKAAIVGKETYSYIGEVVSPGGGGGGSTGGDKPLSVSPRQSVIVGRAIPQHPRKGKKYYFADGVIKVKGEVIDNIQTIKYYRPTGVKVYNLTTPSSIGKGCSTPNSLLYPGGFHRNYYGPVLVTIVEESLNVDFDLTTMAKLSFPRNFSTITESPFLDIKNNRVIVTDVPVPRGYVLSSSEQSNILGDIVGGWGFPEWGDRIINTVRSQYITFSGNILVYRLDYAYVSIHRTRNPKKHCGSIRKFWALDKSKAWTNQKTHEWTARKLLDCCRDKRRITGKVCVLRVRRLRINPNPYIALLSRIVLGYAEDYNGNYISVRRAFFRKYKGKLSQDVV